MNEDVVLIRDPQEFAALAAEWDACLATMGDCLPFLSHAWLSAWFTACAPDAELRVFVLRRGGVLAAAAPLCLRAARYYRVPVRELVWLGHRTSDRVQFLARDDDPELVRALWRRVVAHDEGQALLLLEEVPGDGTLAAVVAQEGGPRVEREDSSRLPRVQVADWEAFENGLARKFRSELRTREKVFASWGDWSLQETTGPEVVAHLPALAELETLSAKGSGGYAFLADPAHVRFLERALAAPDAPFTPVLLRLVVDGVLVAYLLSLAHGDALCAYNMAYRPGHEKGSPGKWMLHQGARWASAHGLPVFDFLRGAHALKARWRPTERTNCRLVVFGRGVRSRLLHTAVFRVRPLLKRLRRRA